jgi:Ankyrin repeats (3 copies)
MFIQHYVRQRYLYLCGEIWTLIEKEFTEFEWEVLLLRFREEIRAFLSHSTPTRPQDSDTSKGKDDRPIAHLLCKVNSALASCSDDADQPAAAARFRREFNHLRLDYQLENDLEGGDDIQLYHTISKQTQEAFESVSLPGFCVTFLPKTNNFFPPTHLAVQDGRHDVAYLLLQGDDCNRLAPDMLGRTCAHLAAMTGDQVLLEHGLGDKKEAKTATDIFHMIPLSSAAMMGHIHIVTKLTESGSDIDLADDCMGRNLLCIASGAGHLPVVQYLVDEGRCRVNLPNVDFAEPEKLGGEAVSYSPLHAAGAGGHTAVVDLLLARDASALHQHQGITAAQEATRAGHHSLASKLQAVEQQQSDKLIPKTLEASKRMSARTPAPELDLAMKLRRFRRELLPETLNPAHSQMLANFADGSFAPSPSLDSGSFAPIQQSEFHLTWPTFSDPNSMTPRSPMHGEHEMHPMHNLPDSVPWDPLEFVHSEAPSMASISSRQASEAPSPARVSLKRQRDPSQHPSPYSGGTVVGSTSGRSMRRNFST